MNDSRSNLLIFVLVLALIIIVTIMIYKCKNGDSICGIEQNNSGTNQTPLFLDDFSGSSLDTNNWNIFTKPDPTHSCARYVDDKGTIGVNNSELSITLKGAPSTDLGGGIYSGRIYSKKAFGPGTYFEAKLKINNNTNLIWPSFWLLPNDSVWPNQGEIDIMETINNDGKNYGTLHCGSTWTDNSAQAGITIGPPVDHDFSQYAIFACKWETNGTITNYIIDGNSPGGPDAAITAKSTMGPLTPDKWSSCNTGAGRGSPAPFDQKNMNMVLNLAVGGDWAGSVAGNICKCDNQNTPNCVSYESCSSCATNPDLLKARLVVDWVKAWPLV